MKALYLETSALARAFLHADAGDYAALQDALDAADAVYSSALTMVELRRAAVQSCAGCGWGRLSPRNVAVVGASSQS